MLGVVVAALWAFASQAFAATTASVSGSTLTATGSAASDQIIVTLPGGDGITPNPVTGVPEPPPDPSTTPYQVDDPAGVTAGAGCTQVSATRADCSRGGAAFGAFTVRLNAGAGNDYLQTIRPTQQVADSMFMSGNDGDDFLGGSQGPEIASGDSGNDLIDGGAGRDFASGGTIIENSPSVVAPTFDGGVQQPSGYSPGPGAGCDRVFGGAFNDQMTDGDVDSGSAAPEPANCNAVLNSDMVDGGVCSGEALPAGVPAPSGVTTCPTLAANVDNPEDHDTLMLGHRTRALTIDVLILTATQGAAGENEQVRRIEAVWAGAGNDSLYGRDGDLGDDEFRGGAGNDRIETRGGDDELFGGDGQDTLLGGAGADVLNPGGHITSQTATATTMVSDGPDVMDGGANSTIVGGHAVTDQVSYGGRSDPLTLNMGAPSSFGAPGENDSITGIEDVAGGHGADSITGDAAQNIIVGDAAPYADPANAVPPLLPPPPGACRATTRSTRATA